MAKPRLTPADVAWIESRLNVSLCADDVAPRPEFVRRAKAQLMDTPLPNPPNRLRKLTLWGALMLVVSAIVVSVLHLRQRALVGHHS
jgi:hypothetical protein